MCKILMPINPCYVEEILSGRKKYEYRKIKPKRNDIEKIIIYSTSPVKKVVAEAEVEAIIEETPEKIWELTKDYSGITKRSYYNYYKNKEKAIAYKLGRVKKYKEPKNLSEFGINYIPQSFVYLGN